MPIFLFALSNHNNFEWHNVIIVFIALHVFIYPSSNAYNSTQDKDEGSIGLIKNPKPIPDSLIYVTWVFDIIGIGLSFYINASVGSLVLLYTIASRLYSYRKIRLKQYPILGYLVVFVFQGAVTYWIAILSLGIDYIFNIEMIAAIASSFLIGSMYPLSQIYQHEQDIKDGVTTISYKLGYVGTFVFSAFSFAVGSLLVIWYYNFSHQTTSTYLYLLFNVPVLVFFNYWFFKVYKNNQNANFKNAMLMNLISCICLLSLFLVLINN